MARPKSQEKRSAILGAAARVIATQGLAASTAVIAKESGVGHGSLFNYFVTKDDLLNALYIELKADLRSDVMVDYPRSGTVKEQVFHIWSRWVEWGIRFPAQARTLAQLRMSDVISPENRQSANSANEDVLDVVRRAASNGALRKQSLSFIGAMMEAMTAVAIDFSLAEPGRSKTYSTAGFEAFWSALAKG